MRAHTHTHYMLTDVLKTELQYFISFTFSSKQTSLKKKLCALCINCTGQSVNERFKHMD